MRGSSQAYICFAFILASLGTAAAQEPEENPAPLPRASFEISQISMFGDYYSSGLPNAAFQAGAAKLPWDTGGGGSVQFLWRKFTERTTFFLSYTPSYLADWRYTSLDALNHSFTLNVSRKITPLLTLGFSAAADLSSYAESLFLPTAASNIAAAPADFQNLAAGLLSGNFANNPLLGVLLTNAPLVQSPANSLVYGEKVLTASAKTSLSYAISPLLSIDITASGTRTQNISASQPGGGANAYLVPTAMSESAGLTLSYSASPVTQIGASLTESHSSSALFDGYTSIAQATFGRTIGQAWILQAHGGFSVTDSLGRVRAPAQVTPAPTGGGSLAYKAGAHTLLGSFDRATAETYGLGASTTSAANATWHWRPPSNAWWLEAGISWQQFSGGALSTISGWRSSFSWNRMAGTHTVLQTQYVYANYSSGPPASRYRSSQNAVRVTVTWMPIPLPDTQDGQ